MGALRLTHFINKKKLAEAVTHIAGYSLNATCFHPLFVFFILISKNIPSVATSIIYHGRKREKYTVVCFFFAIRDDQIRLLSQNESF